MPGILASQIEGNDVRNATGFIRIEAAGANVGDTITVTGPDSGVQVYEAVAGAPAANQWDQSGAPAAEATSLRAALQVSSPDILADIPAQDTTAIFLRVNKGITGAFTLAESTAGVRIDVQDNGDESVGANALALYSHTVNAVEVTLGPGGQGLWRFDPDFTKITNFAIDVLTAAGDYTRIAWTGTPTIVTVGGRAVLELSNSGGAVDIVAGNVINVTIFGQR